MLIQKTACVGAQRWAYYYYSAKETDYQTALWIYLYAHRMGQLADLTREASLVQC